VLSALKDERDPDSALIAAGTSGLVLAKAAPAATTLLFASRVAI
jgi:hypothetical protein